MIKKSVQLLMLSKVSKSDEKALEALMRVKAAGFDSIELNSFMVQVWGWGHLVKETGRA